MENCKIEGGEGYPKGFLWIGFFSALSSLLVGLIPFLRGYWAFPFLEGIHDPLSKGMEIGLLLLSIGLLSQLLGQREITLASGGVGMVLGLLSVIEITGYLGFKTHLLDRSLPGFLKSLIAITYLLTGTALLKMGWNTRTFRRHFLIGFLGSVILAFSGISFFNLYTRGEIFWGGISLFFVGIGISSWAWGLAKKVTGREPRWAPIPVTVGILTITTGLLLIQRNRQDSLLEEMSQFGRDSVKKVIAGEMLQKMEDFDLLAWGWREESWKEDTETLLRESQGFLAIEWMDPSRQEGERFPQIDLDRAFERERGLLLERSDLKRGEVSHPFTLMEGGKGVLFSQALMDGGVLIGYVDLKRWFEASLSKGFLSLYSISIFFENERIYTRNLDLVLSREKREKVAFESSWKTPSFSLLVSPSKEIQKRARTPLPLWTGFGGILIALFFTGGILHIQRARIQLEESKKATIELEKEIHERKRAEMELKALNETLEESISERSNASEHRARELARINSELERFNRLAVGRELRIIELKQRINEMTQEAGKIPPYDLSFLQEERSESLEETRRTG